MGVKGRRGWASGISNYALTVEYGSMKVVRIKMRTPCSWEGDKHMLEDVSTLLGGFRGAAARSGQRRQPREGPG